MAYQSTKPGADDVFYKTGSPEQVADLIAAQDRARAGAATTTKNWAPWIIGGLIVGGGLWWFSRD